MMLINGTVSTAAARVSQVATNRPLEKALAAFARQHAVVLPRTLVSAYDALYAVQCRKSARDVTARRRGWSLMLIAATLVVVVVVVATAAVVNGNGHLLDEMLGAEHRRHRPSSSAFSSGGAYLE